MIWAIRALKPPFCGQLKKNSRGWIPIKNGMPLKFIIFDKVSVKRWADSTYEFDFTEFLTFTHSDSTTALKDNTSKGSISIASSCWKEVRTIKVVFGTTDNEKISCDGAACILLILNWLRCITLKRYLIESAEAVRDDSNADGSAINPNNVVFNQCFRELQDGIVKMSGRNV